jgi:hypothetical protein
MYKEILVCIAVVTRLAELRPAEFSTKAALLVDLFKSPGVAVANISANF